MRTGPHDLWSAGGGVFSYHKTHSKRPHVGTTWGTNGNVGNHVIRFVYACV